MESHLPPGNKHTTDMTVRQNTVTEVVFSVMQCCVSDIHGAFWIGKKNGCPGLKYLICVCAADL